MSLTWKGEAVQQRVLGAARAAVDETMARCVVIAKQLVPVRTATLQGSIEMRPAETQGDRVVGRWGSFRVRYAVYVEVGTGRMSARPYLRPAADREYPQLAERIRRRL